MSERTHIGYEPSRSSRNPEYMFGLVNKHDMAEHVGIMDDAIRSGDSARVYELLQDRQASEQMIIQKGDHGEYLQAFDRGMALMVQEHGVSDTMSLTMDDVDRMMREGHLDPMMFAEWGNANYHLKDYKRSAQLGHMLAMSETMPAVVRANAMNLMGSLSGRQGNVSEARQWNRHAATLLREDGSDDPNVIWQRLKIEHGLIVQRSKERLFSDMVDQLGDIAKSRRELGDVAHIPRTYMDMGDIAYRMGDQERALYYLKQAVEGLEEVGYDSAAVHAADKLARVRQDMGGDRRAKHVWVHGIGIAERMPNLLSEELEGMKEQRDKALKRPAVCLIGLGDENFLVEQFGEGSEVRYMCIAVDQRRSAKAESIIREKIQAILTHVSGQDVSLSKRKTGLYRRGKGELGDGRKYALYSIDLSRIADISQIVDAGLDKIVKDGYTVMSWSELSKQKDLFDVQSQELIGAEDLWRQQQ